MHPRVRALYKQFLFFAPYMPTMDRRRYTALVKRRFLEQKEVKADSEEFKKALAYGRYMLKETQGVIEIHKFRSMKMYDWDRDAR